MPSHTQPLPNGAKIHCRVVCFCFDCFRLFPYLYKILSCARALANKTKPLTLLRFSRFNDYETSQLIMNASLARCVRFFGLDNFIRAGVCRLLCSTCVPVGSFIQRIPDFTPISHKFNAFLAISYAYWPRLYGIYYVETLFALWYSVCVRWLSLFLVLFSFIFACCGLSTHTIFRIDKTKIYFSKLNFRMLNHRRYSVCSSVCLLRLRLSCSTQFPPFRPSLSIVVVVFLYYRWFTCNDTAPTVCNSFWKVETEPNTKDCVW